MKKFFIMAVAAIAALSSCSSDDAVNNEGGQNEKGVTSFTATIASGTTRATATYYNNEQNCKAAWEAGDKISVDGAVYTAASSGLTTNFTGSGATKGGDNKYHAYFPASLCSGTTASLPATMPLEAGKFDMPMYAESETTELSFKNLCGVLAITVPQSEMTSVKSIVVSSDKQMNGEISSITAGGVITFASSSPTDAEKKITLTATSAISTADNVFYVPVPANTHKPLMITISDGTVTKVMTTKAEGVDVARSEIYTIEFKDNRAPWENALQLGKGTATSIVIETGVTIPTSESTTQKKLNAKGNLWEVLEGQTLRIRTSAPKIIGHGTFSTGGLFQGYSNVTSITGLENVDFSEVTDMSRMFLLCQKLENLDLTSLNTSKVTNMFAMFGQCEQLDDPELSNFNTSQVTNMASMFAYCYNLESLNLSSFNTSKVTTMKQMFQGCNKLASLTLSTSINASEVTDMSYMFYNCKALNSLDLSNFNTSKVTTMQQMFDGCNALTSLDLSGSFKTTKVTTMLQMFNGCKALTSLDLSNFNTSEVTNMYLMFNSCEKLSSLTLSNNFVMTNVSNKGNMFQDCGKLAPGSKCTVYGVTDSALKNALKDGTYWYNMKFDGE